VRSPLGAQDVADLVQAVGDIPGELGRGGVLFVQGDPDAEALLVVLAGANEVALGDPHIADLLEAQRDLPREVGRRGGLRRRRPQVLKGHAKGHCRLRQVALRQGDRAHLSKRDRALGP
jgi:hypothetical protein